jgi:hypothetical protein
LVNHLSIKGAHGVIKWSYLPAVTFGPWRYDGDMRSGTLTAQIVSCDEFRANQTPLVAVVPAGRAEWRWTVRDLQISGSTMTAVVERL